MRICRGLVVTPWNGFLVGQPMKCIEENVYVLLRGGRGNPSRSGNSKRREQSRAFISRAFRVPALSIVPRDSAPLQPGCMARTHTFDANFSREAGARELRGREEKKLGPVSNNINTQDRPGRRRHLRGVVVLGRKGRNGGEKRGWVFTWGFPGAARTAQKRDKHGTTEEPLVWKVTRA